jgi:hypothetical protein
MLRLAGQAGVIPYDNSAMDFGNGLRGVFIGPVWVRLADAAPSG